MVMSRATLARYYRLTKPGIIYGNALPTIAGFGLASRGHISLERLIAVLVGQSLVIAAACVMNNYIDRGIDQAMTRTKQRALVTGTISGRHALTFGVILLALGLTVLTYGTNWLTVAVGLTGFVVYVWPYSITKRHGRFGTIVGSIAGAMPPVAGYTAVTSHFDLAAVILFAILVLWQMPHFYAIAMYRLDDYTAANIPVLPARRGLAITRRRISFYITAFTVAVVSLSLFGYAGVTYAIVAGTLGLAWLGRGMRLAATTTDVQWARKMFGFSLLVLTGWCAVTSIAHWLP